MGEAMRLMRSCQLFALALFAALLAVGSAGAESAAPPTEGKGKADDHAPALFVKEGDQFRHATDAEV